MTVADDLAVWTPAGPVPELGGAPRLLRAGAKRIALFRVGDEVRAVDNRCPHEGYALTQGSVQDGLLTCVWHNWKFRLSDGGCVLGGEDVRSYPVRVVGGAVEVDVRDPDPETLAPGLFSSLLEAMDRVDGSRIARDSTRLLQIGRPVRDILRAGLRWGADRAEFGWDHSLATVADCLDLAPLMAGRRDALPAVTALSIVGSDQQRRPVRPVAEPPAVTDLPGPGDAVAALRALVEAERADEAEALFRGLVRRGDPPALLTRALAVVLSDHFLSFGHDMIFGQKSLELLDQLGWQDAEWLLGPHIYGVCLGTREDLLPYLSRFETARREVAGTAVATPLAPAELRSLIPHAPAAELADAVHRSLDGGRQVEAVLDAIALAAADRLLAFDPTHEQQRSSDVGWLDITHTLTFTDAVRDMWRRTREPALLRSVSHAAWFVSRAARYDARDPVSPPPPAAAPDSPEALDEVIDTAVQRRDAEAAVAAAQGWLLAGGSEEALEAAMGRAALTDGAVLPIHVAHVVKTTRAATMERRAVGSGPTSWPLLLGTLRYAASPKTERRTLRNVSDAAKFVR